MYKAIVIDDERISREVISGFLKENTQDFEVCGCFSNGESALEYLTENKVDVVITDIKMPGISGLDLIKEIKKRNYNCYIIIISGYSKFEYARTALQYQVENYILKPIDLNEMLQTLDNIKGKLSEKERNEIPSSHSHNEKKESFFLDLVQGIFKNDEEIKENFYSLEFNLPFDNTAGYLFVVKINDFEKYVVENWKYGKESVYNAFLNVFRTKFGIKDIYMLKNTNMQFFFIGFSNDKENLTKTEIKKNFFEILNVDIDIVKEIRFLNICEVPNLVKDFLNVDNSISILFSHIMNGDEKEAITLFENMCEKENLYDYIVDNIYYRLNELNIHISKMNFFSDYKKTINYLIQSISRQIKKEDFVMRNAIMYIQNNYQNDISREDVANSVYLESTYFSKYFKNKTGETFHNYLFNLRMNKATELLKMGLGVIEVSHKVGYGDFVYFNKKFKQFTGMSPGEYKKQFGENEQ